MNPKVTVPHNGTKPDSVKRMGKMGKGHKTGAGLKMKKVAKAAKRVMGGL